MISAVVAHPATLFVRTIESPLGPILAAADHNALRLLEYAEEARAQRQLSRVADRLKADCDPSGSSRLLDQIEAELAAYFAGELTDFSTPINLTGTPFQCRVWRALQSIPFGITKSYAQLAKSVDSPAAVRAVGQANGANPLSIIVPCHRVIRTGGALGGYGGGLNRKQWLIEHEQRTSEGT